MSGERRDDGPDPRGSGPGARGEAPGARGEAPGGELQRLDPDQAARARAQAARAGVAGPGPGAGSAPATSAKPFSPRRYQWMIGLIGIAVAIAFSVSQLGSHDAGTAGVPAGQRLPDFSAPLAGTTLVGDANLHPPCQGSDHDPRALNTCLLLARGPLVLSFFVTGSSSCERTVDAMQAIAGQFRGAGVQFAAVAVRTGPGSARALVRRRRWTLPVAYDRDGAVGESNGVVVCPLIELVRRGGVVARRLIGKRWDRPATLAAAVRELVAR